MNYYNLGFQDKNFTFSADVTVGDTENGFSLNFSQSGVVDKIVFSGQSGYLFDKEGMLFGGFQKDRRFNLSGYFFFEDSGSRYSYFYNDLLVANHVDGGTGFIDSVSFEDQNGKNSATFKINLISGDSFVLSDSEGFLLLSEGYFLQAG